MYFDESFFLGETRNDFYIRPMVKRAWAAQMEILEDIDRVCNRHGLKWYAAFGTLLGAVRDKGFIAWDDDMDICMRRKDFEKFRTLSKEELPKNYLWVNDRGEARNNGVCRLVNNNRITSEPEFISKYHGCPYIMGIDIYIFDNVPKPGVERDNLRNMLTIAYGMVNHVDPDFDKISKENKDLLRSFERLSGRKIDKSKNVVGQLYTMADQICASYMDRETGFVSIPLFLVKNEKNVLNSGIFAERHKVPFENTEIYIPSGHAEILQMFYGANYMTPIQKPSMHGYPIFSAQEKILFDHCAAMGQEVPEMFRG